MLNSRAKWNRKHKRLPQALWLVLLMFTVSCWLALAVTNDPRWGVAGSTIGLLAGVGAFLMKGPRYRLRNGALLAVWIVLLAWELNQAIQ